MLSKKGLADIVAGYMPLTAVDRERIYRAYDMSEAAHSGQERDSGEPYFLHPLHVATTIAEDYNLNPDSVIAALLHDVVEDSGTSLSKIKAEFGAKVAELVEGLTKLREFKVPPALRQAENYRKFVISISKDIRVLIIKLVDRAHNIETLHAKKDQDDRIRIARETLSIYIPLAERMGMVKIRDIMEEICFKELYPQEYHFIAEKLSALRKKDLTVIDPIIDELTAQCSRFGIKAKIYGREKTPYSIWRKMETKNVAFDAIFDIVAFRFIVESVEDCYRVLGMIHSIYKMVPKRFKDYISTPKPNKYQSLHTTVVGPQDKRIEIQIRSSEMDRIAQYGYAAHWLYKQGGHNVSSQDLAWLGDMAESVRNISGAEEIEEQMKFLSYTDSVFCFTPHGDIKMLPKGATALDFAYEIHSTIGHHCVGAKINRVIRNIKTELANGDYVEILTSKTQTPSPEWERFVITHKARNAIRHYLKNKIRDEVIAYGKSLMISMFAQHKKEWNDKLDAEAANAMKVNSVEELYYLVGSREYTPEYVLYLLHPELNVGRRNNLRSMTRERRENVLSGADLLSNVPIYFAKCCSPLPGDRIIGIVHTGKGITIHKRDCKDISPKALSQAFDLDWSDFKTFPNSTFRTKLSVMTDNHPGALNAVTDVIAKNHGIIYDIHVISRTSDYFDFSITIEVKDIGQLDAIIGELKRVKVVTAVMRRT